MEAGRKRLVEHALSNVVWKLCADHCTVQFTPHYRNFCAVCHAGQDEGKAWIVRYFISSVKPSNGHSRYAIVQAWNRADFCLPTVVCKACNDSLFGVHCRRIQNQHLVVYLPLRDLAEIIRHYLYDAILRCPFCI